ncbi:SET domain-containing protein [Flavihumibacter petaseus]|uniref:SET domain-containing protein n=1 Tax=Flavihumibacter petaseus NBRC 106054 TaxID=1220578 RepID=A0A0E9N1E4_9BACT|nr:SET domain-containing protein [Flavihumibacter petaseus]GAO43664.1 hypothetical protein FPE01S_02_07700 [Flavihumibacter petaseus NBRC 106054]
MAKKTSIQEGKLLFRLYQQHSTIDGTGCFAGETIPARKKIGELGGELITAREGRKRVQQQHKITMVESGNGWSLDASKHANVLRYVNHSCQPNAYLRCYQYKVELYALKFIRRNEEITCDYGETHHDGNRRCNCGMPGCKGFL